MCVCVCCGLAAKDRDAKSYELKPGVEGRDALSLQWLEGAACVVIRVGQIQCMLQAQATFLVDRICCSHAA